MSRPQRIEFLIFIATFFAFAYFHQGGGWNQNGRFAEVRAMVEQGRFALDDFLIYRRNPPEGDLQRVPMSHAEFEIDGKRKRLAWVDMVWTLYPVNETPLPAGVTLEPMIELCSSGDIGYVPHTGHFHPNKPPGSSFLALPAYFVIYQIERWLGIDPDASWTLTMNAWLTTVCSVGVLSALGSVLFFRVARDCADGALFPAAAATLAFAFGTTFFPFGTLLFDHNLTAVLLLASFYFLRRIRHHQAERGAALAGLCAGLAAITNYVAAVAVIFLGLYALLATEKNRRSWRHAIRYSIGVIPPFLLICWYNQVNFGSPFRLANDFQNPLFRDANAVLGMFHLLRTSADFINVAYVTILLTVSPFRGIFILSPVLVLAVWGLTVWIRERTHLADARLCIAIFGFFFLVNVNFNGWHGGFAAGPRYLIPGMPFLALPLVVAFRRKATLTGALGLVSIAQQFLLTATDAQNPLAVGGHARNDRRQDFLNSLVADYAWPLFTRERAYPMLEQLLAKHMDKEHARLEATGEPADVVKVKADALERELREGILRGEASPFLLAAIEGPVSVNPIGIFEGLLEFRHFPPHSFQTRWASFNVGEFFWPNTRRSLLPVIAICGALSTVLLRMARRGDQAEANAIAR